MDEPQNQPDLRQRATQALQIVTARVFDPARVKSAGLRAARLLAAAQVFAPGPIAKQLGRARGALDVLLGVEAHTSTIIDAEPKKSS